MAKTIKYGNDAKQSILAGVEKLEHAVGVTLGPAGKNVIIDEYGSIHSTKDGVTVAKSITLKDPFENLGANAIKEVASKSNDKVGDGTTTSTILAANIYRNGLKYVQFGMNATGVKNGIQKAAKHVISCLKDMSTPVKEKSDIERVCTVSANGDSHIGKMISDVMEKIGNDGVIKIEDGNTSEMTSKVVEGLVFDTGLVSPYLVTNASTMEAELEDPLVLVVGKKIDNFQEFIPCLQSVSATKRPLLVIADDFADDVLATLVVNKARGFKCAAVKSPSYGEYRTAILEDIAIATGGVVVTNDTATKLENAIVQSGFIGSAKRVIVSKDSTVIIGANGDKAKIDARIDALRAQVSKAEDDVDKEKLQERLGRLANGIGIINVGADTEAERKELRDRVDDAFCAAKAAVTGGIVPGGGVALLNVKKVLADKLDELFADDVEKTGAKILIDSLSAPITRILQNADLNAESIIAGISSKNDSHYGFDVISKKYVDMFSNGILDATDVVVNEVQNASSVSGLLLTTEALVVEEPRSDK